MPRRSIGTFLLSLILWSTALACGDLFTLGSSSESPGAPLAGLEYACPTSQLDYVQCFAWSGDGRILFVVLPRTSDTVLVSVNAAATPDAFRVIGAIGSPSSIRPSSDGSVIYFSRRTSADASYGVFRMSLADGVSRLVTNAAFPDFLLTPDGSAVAYHAAGSTNGSDTIVVADVTTGERRRSTTGARMRLGAFSPDANDVCLLPFAYDSTAIWHTTTGARELMRGGEVIVFQAGLAHWVAAVGWTGTEFAALFAPQSGITAVGASGAITRYSTTPATTIQVIGWAPAVSRVFLSEPTDRCGSLCSRYTLRVLTPGGSREIGSVDVQSNAISFTQFSPSPNGRWLAYQPTWGRVFLLSGG
jgi:hypothetical protein